MKILHYMPVPSTVYNHMVIEMINNNEEFNKDSHTFIITNDNSYQISKKNRNVFFCPQFSVKELNKSAYQYDLILIHGYNFSFHEQVKLRSVAIRKMIWCVWGHDLYRLQKSLKSESIVSKLKFKCKKMLFYLIQVPIIKRIKYICIGFTYDEGEIRRLYGNRVKVIQAGYGLGYDFKFVEDAYKLSKSKKEKTNIRIMVGHSSYSFLNHEEILEKLDRYCENDIKVILPLNYGDQVYKEKLLNRLETYKYEIQVISDYLDPSTYLKFLADIDIAIFDFSHQAALSTVYLLLYMGKKIYLRREGVVYKGLASEGVNIFDVDDIGKTRYEEFSNLNFNNKQGEAFAEKMLDPDCIIKQWNDLFELCRKQQK